VKLRGLLEISYGYGECCKLPGPRTPMHFCCIRTQKMHLVIAICGYLRLQKK